MNDEIKLILNIIKDVSEHKEGSRNGLMILSCKDYKTLLDYITNLQQIEQDHKETNATLMSELAKLEEENERLKENNNNMQKEMARTWEKCDNYKSRCEKAIEVINQFDTDKNFTFPLMPKWEEKQVKASIKLEFKDTYKRPLLNILQNGSDSQ